MERIRCGCCGGVHYGRYTGGGGGDAEETWAWCMGYLRFQAPYHSDLDIYLTETLDRSDTDQIEDSFYIPV